MHVLLLVPQFPALLQPLTPTLAVPQAAAAARHKEVGLRWHMRHGGQPPEEQARHLPELMAAIQDEAGMAGMRWRMQPMQAAPAVNGSRQDQAADWAQGEGAAALAPSRPAAAPGLAYPMRTVVVVRPSPQQQQQEQQQQQQQRQQQLQGMDDSSGCSPHGGSHHSRIVWSPQKAERKGSDAVAAAEVLGKLSARSLRFQHTHSPQPPPERSSPAKPHGALQPPGAATHAAADLAVPYVDVRGRGSSLGAPPALPPGFDDSGSAAAAAAAADEEKTRSVIELAGVGLPIKVDRPAAASEEQAIPPVQQAAPTPMSPALVTAESSLAARFAGAGLPIDGMPAPTSVPAVPQHSSGSAGEEPRPPPGDHGRPHHSGQVHLPGACSLSKALHALRPAICRAVPGGAVNAAGKRSLLKGLLQRGLRYEGGSRWTQAPINAANVGEILHQV